MTLTAEQLFATRQASGWHRRPGELLREGHLGYEWHVGQSPPLEFTHWRRVALEKQTAQIPHPDEVHPSKSVGVGGELVTVRVRQIDCSFFPLSKTYRATVHVVETFPRRGTDCADALR